MLLSYKDLMVNENSFSNSTIKEFESLSLFEFGINCIRESNNEILNLLSNIMVESGYMVNEGFKEEFNKRFNFNNIVNSIFKLFINVITKIYNKAKAIITQIIYDDKTIIKYKSLIESYDKSIEVDFDHYNFTYLDKDIPSSSLNLMFSNEYEVLLDKLENIGKLNNKDKVIFELGNLFNKIQEEINHGYYDKIRKSVLSGEDYDDVIFADQYDLALRRFFRGGADAPNRNNITSEEIHQSLNRFLKGKDIIKSIEKHRKGIEDAAEKAKKNINKISIKSIMSSYKPIDYDIEFNLNRVLKLKCGQLSECCNIFILAFSAKLDAIKTCLVQDKKVLFRVVADIISNGGAI